MALRDITGHEHLLTLLGRAASRGTLPSSLIFAGPRGVGKHLTAVALAQTLNCDAPTATPTLERDACGVCAACRRIARRVHADVLYIEPGDTGSIKIEQIREAIEQSAYRPFEGKRRVVIIDDADAIVPDAQNALLKTLEEPPPASTFVLVTARPDTLLITIRSRCQRIRFGGLAASAVAAVLIAAHDYSERDAHAAAALSDGSIGRALEGETEDFIAAREGALRLLKSAAAAAPAARLAGAMALPGAGRGKADRDALGQSLVALASILRDLAALSAQARGDSLANADLAPAIESLRRSYGGDRALAAFASVDRALEALDRNASPKIVADWLSLQI